MGHTHDSVYRALLARKEREKDLRYKDIYVTLYQPQPLGKNCAILYRPDAAYGSAPVHLHGGSAAPDGRRSPRDSWQPAVFAKLKSVLEFIREDKPNHPTQAFRQYEVLDWDKFAESLGLPPATH
jgi:hypothetical protein